VYIAGQVVHTLPEGEAVFGVTLLADEIFLLRRKNYDQVEVYDVITYRRKRIIAVPNALWLLDMTSCAHCQCVYIVDARNECIFRLDVKGATFKQWNVEDCPSCISVNASHNVVVSCPIVRKIKEFSSHGKLLRELSLPCDVIHPWRTIQTRDNGYVVGHGEVGDAVHRVCKISADGRHIVHSHGGQPGSGRGQYVGPYHLEVNDNEFVFVADCVNRRVRLLSPTLGHVRDIMSRVHLKWQPCRLCFDSQRGRLYVVDNEFLRGMATSGRVIVFNV